MIPPDSVIDTVVGPGTGVDPTFTDAFQISFNGQSADAAQEIFLGQIVNVAVWWSMPDLVGKAQFMIKKCKAVDSTLGLEIDLVRKNCYLTAVQAQNVNPNRETLVDERSEFTYYAFSFTTDPDQPVNIGLQCKLT